MPVWDRKLMELGVAPKPRSHHNMDARWLRKTIDRMLNDMQMQSRARSVGSKVQQEDGIG